MHFQSLASALALAGSTVAFSDSSPFVFLSTSAIDNAPSSSTVDQIQTNAQVEGLAKSLLQTCPTKRYLVVDQPGLTAASLRTKSDGCSIPSLCDAIVDSRNKVGYTVSEVIGAVQPGAISDYIKSTCSDQDVSVVQLTNAALPENNAVLGDKLASIMADDSYTVIFMSSPEEPTVYDAEFEEPVKMELKKRVQNDHISRRQDSDRDTRALFEKYQFFTPGVFMGLIATIIMLSILGVALTALNSLQVSYGAFAKDMSPAAQKKQQ
ncbi:Vacuolar ATP synthase subunit S1 (ATP6S1) [Geosmithia morbida]|uniref:Protein BIG1 n=1 Tax=Geosmithia morbida TaxID=1094350 RepID=A0A9P4YSG3_9HYPO|nr:Vacuolar ATP synthase subunit S1 (ATP6S1) [Geosmithia morbida]KAF4120164.1 Vacuolar ATP synthase subunit S1 (ATP6S1) [Geosmithia morbida]